MDTIRKIDIKKELPDLNHIPEPPKNLFIRGSLEKTISTTFVTIVGSRKYTSYGKWVCEHLIRGLSDYPITIVSGLALGIDTIAHKTALEVGLPTIAFPGSGLDWNVLYPRQHEFIAKEIIKNGGAIISEFPNNAKAMKYMFPKRNRLEAGISKMTIIIEAEKKSGTLITARLATDYNKIVGAVPGNINTPMSKGPNFLIQMGAVPILNPEDIIKELGFEYKKEKVLPLLNNQEKIVFDAIQEPCIYDEILNKINIDPTTLSITLSTLEIKGYIRETLGLIERCI